MSNYYASLARSEIDLDEPSVDGMQTCLLLAVAFTAAGKGKKTYMMLCESLLGYQSWSVLIPRHSKCSWDGNGT